MQHQIHTFRAATMDEALDLVRKELGQNVVVVESKEVATRRLLPWPSTRQEIEVSARRTPRKQQSSQTLGSTQRPVTRTIRTLAEKRAMAAAVSSRVPSTLLAAIPELPLDEEIPTPRSPDRQLPPVTEPAITHPLVESLEPQTLAMPQELTSLQTIVSRLERQSRPRGFGDIPNELFEHYLKLTEADIDDEIARELIANLRQHSPRETINSPAAVISMLTALIEREMRCSPPIQPRPGHREIVTLVGPTGVGKTTTLAKLASHFHLREGLRVGTVTVDSYRVGAIEQLRSYAEILQIPFRTASNADELRVVVDELDDVDLLLIDTAGRSPMDGAKLNELRDLIQVIPSDHVLLVMSLATSSKMLSKIAEQFASASPTSLVLTKLDEAIGCGGLLSAAREVPIPVSYLTTGQDVPDRIEPAHPSRLARLILGRDQILCEVNQSPVSP